MLSSIAWGDMGMRLLMHVRAITRNESLGCEKRWRSIGTSWFRGRPSSSELSSRAESSQICRHRSSSPISPFSVSFPYRFRFRPIKRRHIDIHQTSTQEANAASYTCRNRRREMKLGFVMIHLHSYVALSKTETTPSSVPNWKQERSASNSPQQWRQ